MSKSEEHEDERAKGVGQTPTFKKIIIAMITQIHGVRRCSASLAWFRGLSISLILLLGFFVSAHAHVPARKKAKMTTLSPQTETFVVLGKCGMGKARIEGVSRSTGALEALWSAENQSLTVRFNPTTTSLDAIQKAVAGIGHDNAGYRAPDDVYEGLHSCCLYDRSAIPDTAKALEENRR